MAPKESLCAQCARCGETCCQNRDIYVTPADVERIAAMVGDPNFYDYRVPADPAYLDQDDDPVWQAMVIRPDQSRRCVKQQPNRDCLFLGSLGCRLPSNVRPLVCRLHPYDYDHEGIKGEPAPGCPVHLLSREENLFAALDMHRADAQRWHQQLYAEILMEALTDADRLDVRLAR